MVDAWIYGKAAQGGRVYGIGELQDLSFLYVFVSFPWRREMFKLSIKFDGEQ